MSVAVEMIESERSTFDYTQLPAEAANWMQAKGYNYAWVMRDHKMQLRYRHLGYRPLFLKDIEDLKVREMLSSMTIDNERSHGEIHLSDCILMVRSASEQKFWVLQERAKARSMMGKTTMMDEITEKVNRLSRDSGRSNSALSFKENEPNAEAHVHGGRELVASDEKLSKAVRAALADME